MIMNDEDKPAFFCVPASGNVRIVCSYSPWRRGNRQSARQAIKWRAAVATCWRRRRRWCTGWLAEVAKKEKWIELQKCAGQQCSHRCRRFTCCCCCVHSKQYTLCISSAIRFDFIIHNARCLRGLTEMTDRDGMTLCRPILFGCVTDVYVIWYPATLDTSTTGLCSEDLTMTRAKNRLFNDWNHLHLTVYIIYHHESLMIVVVHVKYLFNLLLQKCIPFPHI